MPTYNLILPPAVQQGNPHFEWVPEAEAPPGKIVYAKLVDNILQPPMIWNRLPRYVADAAHQLAARDRERAANQHMHEVYVGAGEILVGQPLEAGNRRAPAWNVVQPQDEAQDVAAVGYAGRNRWDEVGYEAKQQEPQEMKIPKTCQPLDISNLLGRSKNRVRKVGIELEGGWIDVPPDVNKIIGDGSVFQRGQMIPKIPDGKKLRGMGELPSDPMEPAEVFDWIQENYPQVVDNTCGLHIHMSFTHRMHYQQLMIPEFQATILAEVKKWATHEKLPDTHTLWERLAGNSPYCKHDFWPDLQAEVHEKDYDKRRRGNRYTVLNYCYGRYKTLECRLLPMFATADQAVRAVKQIIRVTNASLAATRPDRKQQLTPARKIVRGPRMIVDPRRRVIQ